MHKNKQGGHWTLKTSKQQNLVISWVSTIFPSYLNIQTQTLKNKQLTILSISKRISKLTNIV